MAPPEPCRSAAADDDTKPKSVRPREGPMPHPRRPRAVRRGRVEADLRVPWREGFVRAASQTAGRLRPRASCCATSHRSSPAPTGYQLPSGHALSLRGIRPLRCSHVSAGFAREQGARGGLRAAGDARRELSRTGSTRCRRSSAGVTFAASSPRCAARESDDGGIVWGIGAHVIKTGVSPV